MTPGSVSTTALVIAMLELIVMAVVKMIAFPIITIVALSILGVRIELSFLTYFAMLWLIWLATQIVPRQMLVRIPEDRPVKAQQTP